MVDHEEEILYVKIEFEDEEVHRGYNTDFLFENLSGLEEEFLICHNCNGIMREAVLTNGDTTCLLCSENVNNSNLVKKVNKAVEELAVRCPVMRKCEWVGTLSEAFSHLQECPEFRIACKECNCVLKRSELDDHYREKCPKRLVHCEYCQQQVVYMCINEHINICELAPEICPNKCDLEMQRNKLQSHIAYDCENRFESCAFFMLGCTEKLIRFKDLAAHNKEMMCYHQDLMLEQVKQLQEENQDTQATIKENYRIQNELSIITSKMNLELRAMQTMEGVEWTIEKFIPETEIKGPKFFIEGYKLRCYGTCAVFNSKGHYSYLNPYNIKVFLKRKRAENEKKLNPVTLSKCTSILVNEEDRAKSKVEETKMNFQLKSDAKSEMVADIWFSELSVNNRVTLRLYFNTGSQMTSLYDTCYSKLKDVEFSKYRREPRPKLISSMQINRVERNNPRIFSDSFLYQDSPDFSSLLSLPNQGCKQEDIVYETMKSINTMGDDEDKTFSD